MADMNAVDWIASVLVVIGALNWGLAIWSINLVASLFGAGVVANIVYGLVGLAGLWTIYTWFK